MANNQPPLTKTQKEELHTYEPQLKACVKTGDLNRAKSIAARIQRILKATGHRTRWMQNLNWLCETAIEAGDLPFARQKLESVRKIMNESTRTYLEATALLAICYIREKKFRKSKYYLREAIENINNIQSDNRRRQFHKRLISRIEEECILVGVRGDHEVDFDVDEIQEDAINLLMLDEDSLIIHLGESIPTKSVLLLEGIRDFATNLLPPADQKFLPPTSQAKIPKELGKKANAALKRITWRAVCDPNDEIYQAWSNGLSVVYDKKWITAAIIGACKSWKITVGMVVTSIVALAFKMGVTLFCEVFAPESVMISLKDK